MPGDQGFDPLGLWRDADEAKRRWFREAEILHARWAMLAVVGCLLPEALALAGVDGLGEPVWWKVRSAAHSCPCPTLLATEGLPCQSILALCGREQSRAL